MILVRENDKSVYHVPIFWLTAHEFFNRSVEYLVKIISSNKPLLERDGKFYPIEIKAKTRPNRRDARGLQAFRDSHPRLNVQKGLIIAPSDEIYPVTENDYVIPWDLAS